MTEESGAKKLMGYSFLVVFGNDSTIDDEELDMIKKIVTEDKVVDEKEKEILRMIFSRVSEDTVTEEVWEEITEFKKEYNI